MKSFHYPRLCSECHQSLEQNINKAGGDKVIFAYCPEEQTFIILHLNNSGDPVKTQVLGPISLANVKQLIGDMTEELELESIH